MQNILCLDVPDWHPISWDQLVKTPMYTTIFPLTDEIRNDPEYQRYLYWSKFYAVIYIFVLIILLILMMKTTSHIHFFIFLALLIAFVCMTTYIVRKYETFLIINLAQKHESDTFV